MANRFQLFRLEQLGIKRWNTWRKNHPQTKVDLREAILTGAILTGADLTGADLTRTDLINATLAGANLTEADFTESRLRETDLTEAILIKATLRGANIGRAYLRDATLTGATLTGTDLSGTDLTRATLRGANLTGTYLINATLRGANLTEANLTEVDLTEVDLTRAILTEADFTGSHCEDTVFEDIDLSTTKGLDTIRHSGPSTLGTNTIYRSQGNIPETFLRGCGVPDDMIAYIRSIAGAIQYYTVFISYSSKNRDFTQRLYDNLQGKGIRCWFDQGSLKGGDPFWEVIDQAIIQYDKVIIALSEESIQSPNVAREVEQALAKEQQLREQGTPKTVLFPLTLDYAIKTTTIPWAADIRHTRHIIDFTAWKNEENYQAAFTKLLSDLKAST